MVSASRNTTKAGEQSVIRLKIRGRATQTHVYPISARLRERYRKIEHENSMSESQDDSERVKLQAFKKEVPRKQVTQKALITTVRHVEVHVRIRVRVRV